jgi:hypothetical protein
VKRTDAAAAALFVLLAAAPLRAQDAAGGADAGGLFAPFEVEEATAPLREWPSPFVKELALKLDWPLEKLEKLEKRGFGRTEMISFVAVARKSAKSWDDLVKQREKGATMRSLAEEAGLTYNDVFRESRRVKAEVDAKTAPLERSRRSRLKEAAVKDKGTPAP